MGAAVEKGDYTVSMNLSQLIWEGSISKRPSLKTSHEDFTSYSVSETIVCFHGSNGKLRRERVHINNMYAYIYYISTFYIDALALTPPLFRALRECH